MKTENKLPLHVFHDHKTDFDDEYEQPSMDEHNGTQSFEIKHIAAHNNNQYTEDKTDLLMEDHAEEFKESMVTYNIENGSEAFESSTSAIAFYETRYNVQLAVLKSKSDTYRQYGCKQHQGCPFCLSFG